MEMLDKFVEKIGSCNVLHFLLGGYICALISFVVILQEGMFASPTNIAAVFIGTIAVFVLSLIKELILDTQTDWKDIGLSVLGCIPVFIAVAIGVLFNYLSK